MHRTKSKDPLKWMGVYKRIEDVPDHHQLGRYAEAYEGRDVWAEFCEVYEYQQGSSKYYYDGRASTTLRGVGSSRSIRHRWRWWSAGGPPTSVHIRSPIRKEDRNQKSPPETVTVGPNLTDLMVTSFARNPPVNRHLWQQLSNSHVPFHMYMPFHRQFLVPSRSTYIIHWACGRASNVYGQ